MLENIYKNIIKSDLYELYDDLSFESKIWEPMRSIVFRRLQLLVSKSYNGGGVDIHLKKFGSWVTNQLTPDSDIDLLICGADVVSHNDAVQLLNHLKQNLELFAWVKKVQVLEKAQIPLLMIEADPFIAFDNIHNPNSKVLNNISQQIIKNLCLKDVGKFDNYDTNKGVKVDISVESSQATAHKTTSFVQMAVKHYYSLKLLVILLKYFLHLKGLNIPFKGGLSSYALTLLVIAWLENTSNSFSKNYVELFMGLIYFYGYKFNNKVKGIFFCFSAPDRESKASPYFDLNMYDLTDRGQIFIADPTFPPFKNVCPNAYQFIEIQNQFRVLWDKQSETKTQFFAAVQTWRMSNDDDNETDLEHFIDKDWKTGNLIKKVFLGS